MVVPHVMHTTIYREWKTEEGEREREFGEGGFIPMYTGSETEGGREREWEWEGEGQREEEGDYVTLYTNIQRETI